MGVLISDDRLRQMYAGGRGDATARRYARLWGWVQARGWLPRRWVTLEVPGRRTGKPTRFPVGLADVGGHWYLVSMLGECNWTRNIRANDGWVTLHWGRAYRRHVTEVPARERAPILARYVAKVPGGRPHIPVAPGAPLAEFEEVCATYPVFRIDG
jgi:deazaflavin-dependent oxidoreductase (nitroreductase family)